MKRSAQKGMKKILISLVAILAHASICAAADGWQTNSTSITLVEPSPVYNYTYAPIFIGTGISTGDCGGGTKWVIDESLDPGHVTYAAALAAFTAGKQVKLYQWSCTMVNGVYYSRLGAISVLP